MTKFQYVIKMLYNTEITELLKSKNIKSTAMRILVLQFFLSLDRAVSLHDLEEKFHFSERTTLYRTLKTFANKGLVHQINDGTSSTKYALCDDSCSSHNHTDVHPHFYCEACKSTTCLSSIAIPEIELYGKFNIHRTEFILKGVCDVCNSVA